MRISTPSTYLGRDEFHLVPLFCRPRAILHPPSSILAFLRPQRSTLHAPRSTMESAGVLLEVLLALMLFAAVAAVVTTAFNASVNSLERQKLGAQALNLAASTVAEVQLGIRPANSDGPQAMETPFEDWTWETALTPVESVDTPTASVGGESTGLNRLEVIIRHQKSPTVQRLAQVVRLTQDASTNSINSELRMPNAALRMHSAPYAFHTP